MLLLLISCANKQTSKSSENKTRKDTITTEIQIKEPIIVGADRISEYISLIKNKNIAIVANQTSVINVLKRIRVDNSTMESGITQYHLVDYLNANYNIKVQKVFSPEHGFRGKADAGEKVSDSKDLKTGLPIVSLHGKNKKPTQEQLKGLDAVVFDIQDVGVRFYTYISTLSYVMEACAEAKIPLIVLDRPNPNGHYVDGPTLEIEHKSFLGMHPVPLVYGMTIGEYAQMINGENWLKNNLKCDLTVIKLKNYTHNSEVHLAIRPSPNLPNDTSINLYPSLGFFEGTTINAGRGTEFQFQRYGAPFFPSDDFSYTPNPNFGSKYPKHKGETCNGVDLRSVKKISTVNLKWLIDAYQKTPKEEKFFGKTFTIHAGTKKLQQQIEQGLSAKKIHTSWQKDIKNFKKIRQKYLIYE
ncbi:MAG: DUF1343 domain-containing protein [Flavobacteriaceae bacterium]|nr:DUF1343 domain-containing protein [Flavobacteriaceae bacterium]